MILFAAGRGEALRRFLVDEGVGRDEQILESGSGPFVSVPEEQRREAMDRRSARTEERAGFLVSADLASEWYARFIETVQMHEASAPLREAAIRGQLGRWTKALTSVDLCNVRRHGMAGIGQRAHVATLLPCLGRNTWRWMWSHSSLSGDRRWRFPVAVFELENSRDDDLVAYSLWKVLCVRAKLRVVFCYRRDADEGNALVRHLSEQVAHAMELQDRAALTGETLLMVGSRNEATTFPYGFFKNWQFDTNVGRFARS